MIAFLFASLISASVFAQVQSIKIEEDLISSKTHPTVYSEYSLTAPSFSVDQYDDGLRDLFTPTGSSNLCFPSALATSLINQYRLHPNLRDKLKRLGFDPGTMTIDANALVRNIFDCSKTKIASGTNTYNAVNCLKDLSTDMGLEMDVRLIYKPELDPARLPQGLEPEARFPKPADIKLALDQGFEVIAMIDFHDLTAEKTWKFTSGHYVNVYGYAHQEKWSEDQYLLYITDPAEEYRKRSRKPVYDQILIDLLPKDLYVGDLYSPYYIEGKNFSGFTQRAFLSGLVLYRLSPPPKP